MRAFVAIEVPNPIRSALHERQIMFRKALDSQAGGGGLRWTAPEGMHVTLKFLGEISTLKVEDARRALETVGVFEPFDVMLKGFGFFPTARDPRVFWVGLEPASPLKALAGRVEAALGTAGFEREKRPFSPHLTLARFRDSIPPAARQALLNRAETDAFGRWDVSQFFLFESKLSTSGPPEYRKIACFPNSAQFARG